MDEIFRDFAQAQNDVNGYLLASTISPEPPKDDPARLYTFSRVNAYSIQTDLRYKLQYNPEIKLHKQEATAWQETFLAYYRFVLMLLGAEESQNTDRASEANWAGVYDAWKEVVNTLHKGYQSGAFLAWTIPCLYGAGKYLRIFAIKADDSAASQRDSGIAFSALQEEDAFGAGSKNEKLEDAARQINRIFSMCISDRAPLEESRKWALYYIANLLFKTYFRLNSVSLSKNIIRSLRASHSDMPPPESFPKAHQVTYQYYVGVIHFLEEDYAQAEEHLEFAYNQCLATDQRNKGLILMYLIPTKMLTKHQLPTNELLESYPRLKQLFGPVCTAVRRADLAALDVALSAGETEFVKRRVYLTLERARDVAIRNLFRKVFVAGGFEAPKEGDTGPPVRRTRVPLKEFAAALLMAGAEIGNGEGGVDNDEVECVIANMIYKSLVKGYIARDRGIVVLSKGGAFPGTGL